MTSDTVHRAVCCCLQNVYRCQCLARHGVAGGTAAGMSTTASSPPLRNQHSATLGIGCVGSSQHEGGGPRCEPVPSHDAFPILGKVAQVYRSFGSSVYGLPVERIFSSPGLTSNGKRSVICPENLSCALCIHDNLSLVTATDMFAIQVCICEVPL